MKSDVGVTEPGVRLVGLGLLVDGPLARVLPGEGGRDHQHLAQAAEPVGLEDHPGDPWVHRQPGQLPPEPGQPGLPAGPLRLQRAELLEQLDAGLDVADLGRVDEREAGDLAEAQRGHLQDHAGEVGAQDLRVGELLASLEVLLGVEPDADAVGHPSAASGALVGRGLADRLDRQPLHLGAHAVARDPGEPGVHDVADAGHRQRGLRDVGGQHHPAPLVRGEDPVLLGRAEPGEQRQHVEAAHPLADLGQGLGRVTDLPLAGQEHQHVAVRLLAELADRVDDRLGLVAHDGLALLVVVRRLDQRAVAHLDRVGPPGHLDHRSAAEVLGEALGLDRRGGDDHLQVRSPRQQLAQVAEDEVDVQAALVRLVDQQGVVAAQVAVTLQLGQQDAVGHQLDPTRRRGLVGEPDLVADLVTQGGAELVGDPLGHAARRDPARLGVPDDPALTGPLPRPSSRQILGSWVVFPDPVSPATITTWWSRIAAAMSSRRCETGSSGGKVMCTAPPFSPVRETHVAQGPSRRSGPAGRALAHARERRTRARRAMPPPHPRTGSR